MCTVYFYVHLGVVVEYEQGCSNCLLHMNQLLSLKINMVAIWKLYDHIINLDGLTTFNESPIPNSEYFLLKNLY